MTEIQWINTNASEKKIPKEARQTLSNKLFGPLCKYCCCLKFLVSVNETIRSFQERMNNLMTKRKMKKEERKKRKAQKYAERNKIYLNKYLLKEFITKRIVLSHVPYERDEHYQCWCPCL